MWQVALGMVLAWGAYEIFGKDKETEKKESKEVDPATPPPGTKTPVGPATEDGPKVSIGSVVRVNKPEDFLIDPAAPEAVALSNILATLRTTAGQAGIDSLFVAPRYQMKVTRVADGYYYGDILFDKTHTDIISSIIPVSTINLAVPAKVPVGGIAEVVSF